MASRTTRLAALLIGTALALVPLASAPTVSVPRTTLPDDAAAGWLARQLTDGDHLETSSGGVSYPDQGVTVDAVLAFAAAKVSGAAARRATAWLAEPANLAGYLGDGGTEAYAGPTAKLLLLAEVRGAEVRAFGGVDLPARLLSLLTPSGRFADRSPSGDFSNAFGQSYAILALNRTAVRAPASASAFLVSEQCADGGVPISFGVAPCAGDVDATALAVQALRSAGRTAAASKGIAWLAARQQSGGGLAAGDGTGIPNANSTGLARQAFADAGQVRPALEAAQALVRLQLRCSAPAADRGAVAFDSTGFDPAIAPRATAQAVLSLTGVGLAQLTASGSAPAAPVLAC